LEEIIKVSLVKMALFYLHNEDPFEFTALQKHEFHHYNASIDTAVGAGVGNVASSFVDVVVVGWA
jgi:hypothetical protein